MQEEKPDIEKNLPASSSSCSQRNLSEDCSHGSDASYKTQQQISLG
jgi:hypothetical protein